VWHDEWVSFLDAMMQMQIIAAAGRDLKMPTRIRSLRIDPVAHEKFVSTLDDGTKGIMIVFQVLFVGETKNLFLCGLWLQ